MKVILTQFGVRKFQPVLRKAADKIGVVRTPEGVPLPSNAAAALWRHIDNFGWSTSKPSHFLSSEACIIATNVAPPELSRRSRAARFGPGCRPLFIHCDPESESLTHVAQHCVFGPMIESN
jgi:hypothetical protein